MSLLGHRRRQVPLKPRLGTPPPRGGREVESWEHRSGTMRRYGRFGLSRVRPGPGRPAARYLARAELAFARRLVVVAQDATEASSTSRLVSL